MRSSLGDAELAPEARRLHALGANAYASRRFRKRNACAVSVGVLINGCVKTVFRLWVISAIIL